MALIRVALAQLNMSVGDLESNALKLMDAYEQSCDQDADLVVFSELAICGYPPEDLLLKPRFLEDAAGALARVAKATREAVAVIGFPELSNGALYNAAAVCSEGRIAGTYRKQLLPNYSVFDEKRYFVAGTSDPSVFRIADINVGISVCEDLWFDDGPLEGQIEAGVSLALSINASPYQRGKDKVRASTVVERTAKHETPVVYLNQVGGQDELIFDGASFVAGAKGEILTQLPQFEEAYQLIDIEVMDRPSAAEKVVYVSSARRGKVAIPSPAMAPSFGALEEVWSALVLATRDYVHKNGFEEVVIGLSGGVDSSLVAAIAVDALGAKCVHGISMPSRYSSQGSQDDAKQLALNLGIDFSTIPIEPAHAAFTEMLDPSFSGLASDLTEENLQSRIRGVILMALSNKRAWLVLTTGNKSETSVGYSTLYGDTAGGFAILKDCPKLLVYELCRWRNAQEASEWIPESSISKPPSAELRPNQTDDESLPPYELLDGLLEAYVEQDQTADELLSQGYDSAIVEQITRLVDLAEYKRRQSPPGPRISEKAFGKDRRLPITNRYR